MSTDKYAKYLYFIFLLEIEVKPLIQSFNVVIHILYLMEVLVNIRTGSFWNKIKGKCGDKIKFRKFADLGLLPLIDFLLIFLLSL